LSPEQREELFSVLKVRSEENRDRYQGLDWAKVAAKLAANPENCGRSMKWRELVDEPKTRLDNSIRKP
jgi:hypothetical protein